MNIRKRWNIRGMTLIEIIVAIAILGIMAASFLTVFYSGYATIFNMGRKTEAMNEKAQSYMDMLYEDYSAGMAAMAADTSVTVVEDTASPYSSMGLTPVTITVQYPQDRTVTLTSLVPNGG